MLLKSAFGVAAAVLSIFALHTVAHNYTLLKTRKFSVRYILRTLSSIGVILPLECFLLYVFVSYNGAGSVSASTFFTQSLVLPNDVIFSVMSQQTFVVNALKIISAISFGSAVVFTLAEGLEYVLSSKKPQTVSSEQNTNAPSTCARIYYMESQPAYLRFGAFLS